MPPKLEVARSNLVRVTTSFFFIVRHFRTSLISRVGVILPNPPHVCKREVGGDLRHHVGVGLFDHRYACTDPLGDTDLPQFVVPVPMLVQAAISHPSARAAIGPSRVPAHTVMTTY